MLLSTLESLLREYTWEGPMGSALFAHGCVWGRLHQGFEKATVGKPLSGPQEDDDGDHGAYSEEIGTQDVC